MLKLKIFEVGLQIYIQINSMRFQHEESIDENAWHKVSKVNIVVDNCYLGVLTQTVFRVGSKLVRKIFEFAQLKFIARTVNEMDSFACLGSY